MKTLLLSALAVFASFLSFSQVTINEVDSNTPGTDMAEFVELYAASETSLDGYVLVFFNGNSDLSYRTIDLSGETITDGYFVVGNVATPNVDITFDDNGLQNGQDAVGLYLASAADWADDTPFSDTGIVDLLVYDSNDDDDAELLGAFTGSCQIQYNEDENGDDDNQSIARVPDGGTAMCPTDFLVQAPSPGTSNIPSCFGGSLAFDNTMTEMALCIDDDAIELINFSVVNNIGDGSIYIITDDEDIIIGTSNGEEIDSSTLPEGVCRIHGVAYNGTLDAETTSAGEDAAGIATDGDCLSFSSNYLTITRNVCFPDCDGGIISSDAGENVIVCLDDEEDIITFDNNSIASEASFLYALTDEDNILVGQVAGGSGDFNILDEGVYRVWGVSFLGTPDLTTIEPGDPLFGIMAADCVDFSENYVTVTAQECVAVEGCGSLFFSEYIEGSSNNKALEIYNPSQLPISLADYQLVNCSNGCDVADEWDFVNDILGGATLGAGDVFVIAHSDAVTAITDEADVLFNFLSNGNDVFALQQISTGDIIDIIGDGSTMEIDGGWTVNGVDNGTQNHTLVRMETFNEGNPDWATAQNEWNVLEVDDFSNIGSHTIIPCSVNTDPSLSFSVAGVTVNEDVGTVSVEVSILNPLDEEMTVEVMLTGGTAVTPDDFDGTGFPITLTFPAGMDVAQSFDVSIIDDIMEEGSETIVFELMNPSAGISLGANEFTLTINPSDVVIPVLDIVDVITLDTEGVATNLDLECELRGVVYGVNLRPSGLQFTLIDPTDGIGVISFEPLSDYVVNEGDSVHVVGIIDQFNGLTQIEISSITLISADNDLIDATVVTELNEFSESNLITVECLELVDASQWTNDGSGFNVDLTDGTNTFLMRVDADTDVFGTDAPEGAFTLTGLGGQFDNSSPYDEGYQILPRYIADVPEGVSTSFTLNEGSSDGVELISGNEYTAGPGSIAYFEGDNSDLEYTWEINGSTTMDTFVEITIEDDSWNGEVQDLTVTATDGTCTASSTTMITFLWLGIEEYELELLSIYPNPSVNEITIDIPSTGTLRVYNSLGQVVREIVKVNVGTETLNVSNLVTGTYFVEVTSENSIYRAQLVKK